jgi:hypothetical protein
MVLFRSFIPSGASVASEVPSIQYCIRSVLASFALAKRSNIAFLLFSPNLWCNFWLLVGGGCVCALAVFVVVFPRLSIRSRESFNVQIIIMIIVIHCWEIAYGATVALSFFSPVALGFSVVASLLKWICFCNGQNMILFRVTDMQESTPCCSEWGVSARRALLNT